MMHSARSTSFSIAFRVLLCMLIFAAALPVRAAAQTAHFSYVQQSLGGGFTLPYGTAVDGNGNVFVADFYNNAVKMIPPGCVEASCVKILGSGFYGPTGVAVDSSGNVFVTDDLNNQVKEILAAGGYTTVNILGGAYSNSFNRPNGIAVDHSGNVFVADTGNNEVEEIPAAGGYTTVYNLGGSYYWPVGVAVDANGNVFVADDLNGQVKEILAAGGYVTVNVLGSGFVNPVGVAVDAGGNVFVSDWGKDAVAVIPANASNTITTLITGIDQPTGISVDGNGNIFLDCEFCQQLQEIEPEAVNFATIAIGSTSAAIPLTFTFDSAGSLGRPPSVLTQGASGLDFTDVGDGTCTTNGTTHAYNAGDTCTVDVTFTPKYPGARSGAVVLQDASGNAIATAYVYGVGSAPLAAFGPGTISTVAGTYDAQLTQSGMGGYSGDGGPATSAQLFYPLGVAFDGAGNLYIADQENLVVRKVTPAGTITTVAGSHTLGLSGDGGPATSAKFLSVTAVAADGAGNLFVADYQAGVIRKVTPGGTISTVAGDYSLGFGYGGDGGPATSAQLWYPIGIAVDGVGNIYIADEVNQVIRKVVPGGTITTVAGNNNLNHGYSGDGGPATAAQLWNPEAVAVDGAGNLYIADWGNSVIRKVTPNGMITTVAGVAGQYGYSGDNGPATAALLYSPTGVAVDGAGDLYIVDYWNFVIRKVSTSGIITTVAGLYQCCKGPGNLPYGGYGGDGGPATSARLDGAWGIALDPLGNLYIADQFNNLVRKVDVSDPPSLTFATTSVGAMSAAQDVTLLNVGNAPLTVSQISTASNFSLGGPDTSCDSSGETLQAAATCVLGIEFAPIDVGNISGSVVLTDNTLNATAATQTIALQAAATPAATTTTVTPPASAYFTNSIKLTATVDSATSIVVSGGTVTFLVANTTLGTAPVANGTATLNNVPVSAANGFASTSTITANYSGSASFAASSGSATLPVTVPTYTLAASPAVLTVNAGSNATATLNLASTGYNGTVSFTAVIRSANGTVSAVTASAPSVTLTAGSNGSSTLTVTTAASATSHAPVSGWKGGGAVIFCAVLLGAPFSLRRSRAAAALLTALVILLAGLLLSCASKAPRIYTVTVTPSGTATVTDAAPLSITLTVQ
jgi:streptogramin lyase